MELGRRKSGNAIKNTIKQVNATVDGAVAPMVERQHMASAEARAYNGGLWENITTLNLLGVDTP